MAASEERRKEALLARRVRPLQRRLNAEISLRFLIVPLWAAATLAVLYRFVLGPYPWVAAAALGVGALIVWSRRSRSHRVSLMQAAILADRGANAGGLLLTRMEVPVGEWE